jgi:hypothetical protein
MWELIPRVERPDAQVLVTLPNSEREYVDGFLYQEFRAGAPEGRRAALLPAGAPHTRYRYLPWLPGTHVWQHRTPPGGILEQGAFVVEHVPAPSDAVDPVPVELSQVGDEVAGLRAHEERLETLARDGRGARVSLDAASAALFLPGGEPDLARGWLLDALFRAADSYRVGVVLRLPWPPEPPTAQLEAILSLLIRRYSAMPALAGWELAGSGETGEEARRFLQAYDPRHPVIHIG